MRRGLFPLGGSTVRLRRQIPYTIAAEILLTGRHVPAPEAQEIGLIGHVVPDGQALAKAREIADRSRERPARRAGRAQSPARDRQHAREGRPANELEIGRPVFGTNDAKEGPTAFAEKREPKFTGT